MTAFTGFLTFAGLSAAGKFEHPYTTNTALIPDRNAHTILLLLTTTKGAPKITFALFKIGFTFAS
ncbi:hypothetical protein C7N43_05330 [Sphingobacteriales bacterium UPWRP_1]|nr:hypothetical protein BVG80_09825 [Sphingobacteriales bacterium TSM_CSM]PSJ78124.1 hypothetical protein C7N43_05330 [Sphingobacteriales bacterium UPWRP_1]